MELSQDKQKALAVFNTFMQDSKAQTMLIQGPPGTGKTQLINELVESYINTNQVTSLIDPKTSLLTSDNIVLTATTNKAKKVIMENVTDRINTQYKMDFRTATLHSVLGLRMFYNYKMELDYCLDENSNPFFFNKNNCLLVIDEASYVDSKLHSFILNQLEKSPQLKVVYIADKFQGKPVNEDVSNIFTGYDYYAELTERFRFPQDGSIHQNSVMLENHIKGDVLKPLIEDEHYKIIGHAEFIKLVNEQIVAENPNTDTRIVVYHNNLVKDFNQQIQIAKYGTSDYQVGQQLINNEAFISKKFKTSIPNEATVVIKKIDSKDITLHGITCTRVQLQGHASDFFIVKNKEKYKEKLNQAKREKDWSLFFSIKETFIDLRPIWAMTSHKSQGSTFDNVIVDFNDLESMRCKEDFPYMLNVATTRARNTVYLYRSDLP